VEIEQSWTQKVRNAHPTELVFLFYPFGIVAELIWFLNHKNKLQEKANFPTV